MYCRTLIKRVIPCFLAFVFFALPSFAEGQAGDGKFRGQAGELLRAWDARGETGVIGFARSHGMKVRSRAGGHFVPLIIELQPGVTTSSFDRASLERSGIIVDAASTTLVRVLVPPSLLRTLARHPQIRFITIPLKPIVQNVGLGTVVSEAVGLTNDSLLQVASPTINGTGVKVAVIDGGYIGLQSAITAGALPSSLVQVALSGQSVDSLQTSTNHGTAVAEELMSMAPGATLYLIMITDQVDFQNAAAYVKANGIRVVNHSMGWVNSSYYNDKGPIDSIVDISHDSAGVFWSVSAGNEAQSHWCGAWSDPANDSILHFNAIDKFIRIATYTDTTLEVYLNWNQYGDCTTDLYLYVYNKDSVLVDSSTYRLSAGDPPIQNVSFFYQTSDTPYNIMVKRHSGPATNLNLSIFTPNNTIASPVVRSSIVDPADAHGAFAVAAINKANYLLAAPYTEYFSGQGPTTDGRMKPDITAPDRTSTFTLGAGAAGGTSFTAPVVAGAAACLLQKYPSLSVIGLADTLQAMARDVGTAGIDSAFGAGLLYAYCAPPQLGSPSNAATGVSLTPTIAWSMAPWATSYRAQVSTVSSFTTLIADDSTLTAGSMTLSGLSSSQTYYWRVRAQHSSGVSPWTAAWSFTTIAPPGAPTLSAPANAATNVSVTPTLAWETVSGAATYRVQISTSNAFATTIVNDSAVTAVSLSVTTGLTNNTVYYWRVNAKNAGGTSAWTTAWSFMTVPAAPAAPTLSSPANAMANVSLTPSLTWTTVSGAGTYRVQLSTISTFASLALDDSTLTGGSQALTVSLTTGTTYYWRVDAKNAGGTSAWSTAWNFTTVPAAPAVPTLSAPANAATNVSVTPTLTWTTSAGAATYRVQISTSTAFATTIVNDSTVTALSLVLTTALSNNTVYYWRVNGKNSGGTSAWITAWSFTTIPAVPWAPTLASPANAAIGIAVTPMLTWRTVATATTYKIEVSTAASFTTLVADDSILTAGSYTIAMTLANNTVYYWRANAKNAGGTSAWSTAWSFTTIVAPPPAPVLSSPPDGDSTTASLDSLHITLAWGAVSGATEYRVQVSTSTTFANFVANDSTVTAASRTDTLNARNTRYYWRVGARDAGGWGNWSAAWNFKTLSTGIINNFDIYNEVQKQGPYVLEIYLSNGKRVIERDFDAILSKAVIEQSGLKSLACGFYIYRIRLGGKVLEAGSLLKR